MHQIRNKMSHEIDAAAHQRCARLDWAGNSPLSSAEEPLFRVFSPMSERFRNTLDTVTIDAPTSRAISFIVRCHE